MAKLQWTHYALLLPPNRTENRCCLEELLRPSSLQYPDFMPHALYYFTDKHMVQHNRAGTEFHAIWAIFAFFLLSLLFQWGHCRWLLAHPSKPRVLHYVENTYSSSLMIVVMAVCTGILERFAITGL